MRILYIVPYTPNLIRVRPYNLIRYLSARGHEVTVLTQYANAKEHADAQALEAHCDRVVALPLARWRSLWNCLRALPTDEPLQAAYCWQPATVRLLDDLTNGNGQPPYDLIHVEHLRGARYGLALKKLRRPTEATPPIVWDSVDCISLLFRRTATSSKRRLNRWVARFELARTERYEGQLADQFDRILLTSPVDREAFLTLNADGRYGLSATKFSVLANGVDVDYFTPPEDTIRDSATVVLTGKMSYHANVTMALYVAEEIMPLVWRQRPEVKLQIVGKDPVREVAALAQNPAIEVTGSVPDMRPYLQRATVAAVPIAYGAGIQNKVLEAMACATPVVTTPQAVTAISAVPGRDLLVAGNAETLAEEILCLLSNPAMQRSIGQSGRSYVERHHDWRNIVTQLEEIYHDIIVPIH